MLVRVCLSFLLGVSSFICVVIPCLFSSFSWLGYWCLRVLYCLCVFGLCLLFVVVAFLLFVCVCFFLGGGIELVCCVCWLYRLFLFSCLCLFAVSFCCLLFDCSCYVQSCVMFLCLYVLVFWWVGEGYSYVYLFCVSVFC